MTITCTIGGIEGGGEEDGLDDAELTVIRRRKTMIDALCDQNLQTPYRHQPPHSMALNMTRHFKLAYPAMRCPT